MKVNQLKAGAVLSYVSMGLGYLVSMIFTPIMIRLLGQNDYGLYNLVSSVVSYLSVLNFGFGSAYIRYYSLYKVYEDKENIAKLNGMFLIIYFILGLVAVLAGILLAINTDLIFGAKLSTSELKKAKVLLIILVINLSISFPNIVFNSFIIANEKFIFQNMIQMIKILGNPFLVLPALLTGYGSVGMVIATTILNAIVEIINAIYCIKKLNMNFMFSNFDIRLMKEMTIFSSYIFINLVIDQINWNVDKFVLGRFHGTVSVAIYGVASQLNNYYIAISTAISNVFIPRVHKMVVSSEDNIELTKLFTKIGRVQLIILALISSGLIFFGKPFINLWAGNNYKESYPIALLLILPVTVPLIQNIGIEIQRAKNLHKFRSLVYFFIALANLTVSIPLASKYGGIGAALGTALSLIIGNGFVMNWYYKEKVGLDIKYFWKQILRITPAFIPPLLFGILIINYINQYKLLNFIGFGILYVIIYCLSMFFLGMNTYEKELIIKPIRKLFKIIK